MQVCKYNIVNCKANREPEYNAWVTKEHVADPSPARLLEEMLLFQFPQARSCQVSSACSSCRVPDISTIHNSSANELLWSTWIFKNGFYPCGLMI